MSRLELFKRKLELAREILRITESTVFTDDPKTIDDETERFIALYDERDALIAELLDVRDEIQMNGDEGDQDQLEIDALNRQAETCLQKVVELDKRNQDYGKNMLDNVKSSIKRINQGRNISLKYNNELQDTDGYMLNQKN